MQNHTKHTTFGTKKWNLQIPWAQKSRQDPALEMLLHLRLQCFRFVGNSKKDLRAGGGCLSPLKVSDDRAFIKEQSKAHKSGRKAAHKNLFAEKFCPDDISLKMISASWGSFGAAYVGVPRIPPQTPPSMARFRHPSPEPEGGGGGGRQAMDGLWTGARGQQKQSNDPVNNQHIHNTPTIGRH